MDIPSSYRILHDPNAVPAVLTDCNCACATAPVASTSLPAGTTPVQRHRELQALALDDEHAVVFVPSQSRVAVLNAASMQLLADFATPRPLASDDPAAHVAAHTLYDLGLLHTQGVAAPVLAPPDELIAWLHVTNDCNLRCTYCYVHKTHDAMTASTALAAVDAVFRTARLHGYQRVALKYAGGEASLALDQVATIHAYAEQQAVAAGVALRAVLLSNGVGLSRAKLALVQQLGLDLMISLDGDATTHDAQRPRLGGQGSFVAARAAVLRAHELGIPLTVSVTVTADSVGGLPNLLAWLLDNGIFFTLNFYRECDTGTSIAALHADEARLIAGMRAAYRVIATNPPRYSLLGCLLDRVHMGASHRRTCAVGENYLVIDQHGSIAACQMTIDEPVTDVWQHDPLIVVQQSSTGVQNLPVEHKSGCRSCPWQLWCAGGCAVATFRATGRYDVQSPNCGIYTALYPDVLRLEGLRLLRWHAAGATA